MKFYQQLEFSQLYNPNEAYNEQTTLYTHEQVGIICYLKMSFYYQTKQMRVPFSRLAFDYNYMLLDYGIFLSNPFSQTTNI